MGFASEAVHGVVRIPPLVIRLMSGPPQLVVYQQARGKCKVGWGSVTWPPKTGEKGRPRALQRAENPGPWGGPERTLVRKPLVGRLSRQQAEPAQLFVRVHHLLAAAALLHVA